MVPVSFKKILDELRTKLFRDVIKQWPFNKITEFPEATVSCTLLVLFKANSLLQKSPSQAENNAPLLKKIDRF